MKYASATRIARLRNIRDIKQATAAKALGITQGHYSRLETYDEEEQATGLRKKQQRFSPDQLRCLALLLQIPVQALAVEDESMWFGTCWQNPSQWEMYDQIKRADSVLTFHKNIESYLEPTAIHYAPDTLAFMKDQPRLDELERWGQWHRTLTAQKRVDREKSGSIHRIVTVESHFLENYQSDPENIQATIDLLTKHQDHTAVVVLRTEMFAYLDKQIQQLLGFRDWLSVSIIDDLFVQIRPKAGIYTVSYDEDIVGKFRGGANQILDSMAIRLPKFHVGKALAPALASLQRLQDLLARR